MIFSLVMLHNFSCHTMFIKNIRNQTKNIFTPRHSKIGTYQQDLNRELLKKAEKNIGPNPLLNEGEHALLHGHMSLGMKFLDIGHENALMASIIKEQNKLIEQWPNPIQAQAFRAVHQGKLKEASILFQKALLYDQCGILKANPQYKAAMQAVIDMDFKKEEELLSQGQNEFDEACEKDSK